MHNQATQIVDGYTKLGKSITTMATELNRAKEIINECSDWLTYLGEMVNITEEENIKLDELIGNINDILGR